MINYIKLVEDAENGEESPFKAMAILQELQKEIKECMDQIKPIVIQEAAKYDKTFEKDGFKIEQRNGRRTWNYKGIPEWMQKEKEKKEIEETAKEMYSLYEKGKLVVDQETGEMPSLPEVTYSEDVVVIKNLGSSLIR
jgi:DNA mismatch repair ATPase MutL